MFENFGNINIHSSWLELIPRKQDESSDSSNEEIEDYIQRIGQSFKNIPEDVLRQWLYFHTQNPYMINNYGWIDYHQTTFVDVFWTQAEISQIQVFSRFRPYVESRAKAEYPSGFMCSQKDKDYWANFGTWRIPVVVLKTDTIKTKPHYSELNRPYQLIEGHTRLGYFKAFCKYREKGLKVAKLHKLYLMDIKQ